jgi:hypothetical protein
MNVTAEQAKVAIGFARDYTGDFGFLQDMRTRAITGQQFSENMLVAILRCMARENKPQAAPQAGGIDLRAALPTGTVHVAVGEPLQFFKIDNVDDGKWAGWVFVKRQYGDNYERVGSQRPGDTYRGGFQPLLQQVLQDPLAAAQAYGLELGQCAICNRSLTDETSRARGIGPDCWERLGAKVTERANREWAEAKNEFAKAEAAQERAAFLADAATWE